MTRLPASRLRGAAALLAAGALGATAALTVPAGAQTVAARKPVPLAKVAKFAKKADKVDGFHAVGATASPADRSGKLVATDGAGRLPNDIVGKVSDADRLDGLDSSAYRFISLDLGAGLPSSTTSTFGVGAFGTGGIAVPNTGNNSLGWSFTLPPDYPTGATMTIRLQWHVDETGCSVQLLPNSSVHDRPGLAPDNGNSDAGLTGPFSVPAPATAETTVESVFTATPPRPGTQFRAGDSYLFSLFRGADSCTEPVLVTGASVTY